MIDKFEISALKDYLAANNESEPKIARGFLEDVVLMFDEIQQYRAVGTVDKIQKNIAELGRWRSDRLNDKIKNPTACMSTLICHNCDHKDEYIEELEFEIEEYKEIGTVEEFREAMEKQKPNKPVYPYLKTLPTCPNCGEVNLQHSNEYGEIDQNYCHCPDCGQRLDWSDTD